MNRVTLFFKHLVHALKNAFHPVPPPIPLATVKYSEHKHKMKTGDVIAVAKGEGVNASDKLFGMVVSRLTGYIIYHVGTIIVTDGRWLALEAIIPKVYPSLLSRRTPFYHIAVTKDREPIITEDEFKTLAFSTFGLPYSITDVIQAYWEVELNSTNGVICTELVNWLLSDWIGVDYPGALIPGEYIEVLEKLGFDITLVVSD